MIKVIEEGIVSEPELIDFIIGYRKLVEANVLSSTVFDVVMTNLGIDRGQDGEYYLNKTDYYKL